MININPTIRSSYCSNKVKVATRENSPLIRELEEKARKMRRIINSTDKAILNSPLTGIKNPDKITVGEMDLGLCGNLNHFINRLRANINDKDALDAFNRTYEILSRKYC